MKKCLLLIALLTVSQLNVLRAQTLFSAPTTVCIHQPVTLVPDSLAFNAMSYYWGFCSGYLMNTPTGTNLGDSFSFHIPSNIDIAYDSGNYYGFVINSETTEFIRLNFGNSLSNYPTITNFGDLTKGLPVNPTSLFILKDTFSHSWHIFVSGGFTQATSTLGRIDFGPHLDNPHPNIANFGNYNGMLNYPVGIFIAQDSNNNWYGYILNHNTDNLLQLDFSFNVSNTPLMTDYGNPGGVLSSPTDLAAIKDQGKWYLFITDEGVNSSVARVDLDSTLHPSIANIAGTNLGNFDFRILQPSSISINKDCGSIYAYITDNTTSQLIGISMPAAIGPYHAVDYNNVGFMNFPTGISSILRDNNDLWGFIVNAADSTLTRVAFEQCHNSSIPSFTELTPPVYQYDSPGVYNVYFVINQGLPTMEVDCKTINVLAYPPIVMNPDTTICEGDTLRLYVVSTLADSIAWQSNYNIDTSYIARDSVKVYPDYNYNYGVIIFYPFGCIVDTNVQVNVSKVKADAGPDRWIHDGATTIIGGPYTSEGSNLTYHWEPYQFLSDSAVPNPAAFPPFDYTYYLTVTSQTIIGTDTLTCQSKDTVVVHTNCGDIYLPNAFAPNSESSAVNHFGIINKELIQLNYFRIFDRWGVEVFNTTDPNVTWDGNYGGKPCPVDVYVWEADGFCINRTRIKKSGNVTLLR